MILTDTEIRECLTGGPKTVARMIEAAVLSKLSQGVSVEPVAWIGLRNGIEHMTSQWKIAEADSATYDTPLYTTTAIAAARVAENERCANWLDKRGASAGGRDLDPYRLAIGIRALKGGTA